MALTALQARNSIAVVEDIANDRKKQRRKLKNFKSKSEASETEELLDKDNGAPANQKIVRTQSVRMEPRQTQYQKNALLQERNASGMSDLDMLLMDKDSGSSKDPQPGPSGLQRSRSKIQPRRSQYEAHPLLQTKNATGMTEIEILLNEKRYTMLQNGVLSSESESDTENFPNRPNSSKITHVSLEHRNLEGMSDLEKFLLAKETESFGMIDESGGESAASTLSKRKRGWARNPTTNPDRETLLSGNGSISTVHDKTGDSKDSVTSLATSTFPETSESFYKEDNISMETAHLLDVNSRAPLAKLVEYRSQDFEALEAEEINLEEMPSSSLDPIIKQPKSINELPAIDSQPTAAATGATDPTNNGEGSDGEGGKSNGHHPSKCCTIL